MRVALDVMGGDLGCEVAVRGAFQALRSDARLRRLCLVGREEDVRSAMGAVGLSDERVEVVHASEVMTMDDKPATALRKKKDCSLLRGVELIRDGRADALVSTGNTGGLMAAATIRLRLLEGVERPAIATVLPSMRGEFVLLDSGANPDCRPVHLAQFAVMGSQYARDVLGHASPRVGILSNGSEDFKGNDLTREAVRLCRHLDLNFLGNVEGHDLFAGNVDVVVTDGFVGNIVLKSCESLGKSMVHLLRQELTASPVRKLGAWISRGALRAIRRRLDPDAYGGAPLLGLNGTVIKAHGSAGENAIANAIRVAAETVAGGLNETIVARLAAASAALEAAEVGGGAAVNA